jgi:L-seryl-tRNA(Ser) seleniumtransferase
MSDSDANLRQLPAVDALASRLDWADGSESQRVEVARTAIEIARRGILEGQAADADSIASGLIHSLIRSRPQRVINATGVLLHTNLGRAPVSTAAAEAASRVAEGYSNIEVGLDSGERGQRGSYTAGLLRLLTGAEDGLVVNNNAAAIMLALAAVATGRAVPVSRGELIEIGGSYRLPEVMAASGARMVEVGTTNKTRVGDFETALQINECGAVLKIHPSNYEISGFTAETRLSELVKVARKSGVPVIYDIGSGLLDATTPWLEAIPVWLRKEPGARQAIAAGVDLVTFSGDKLLGGPQAGIVVGSAVMIGRLRSHPLCRALRVSAPIDAALAATLDAYAGNTVVEELPFWRMAQAPIDSLRSRAISYLSAPGASIVETNSVIGAGSAPSERLESIAIRFEDRGNLFEALLHADPSVLARRDQGDLLLDLRSVYPEDDEKLCAILQQCL